MFIFSDPPVVLLTIRAVGVCNKNRWVTGWLSGLVVVCIIFDIVRGSAFGILSISGLTFPSFSDARPGFALLRLCVNSDVRILYFTIQPILTSLNTSEVRRDRENINLKSNSPKLRPQFRSFLPFWCAYLRYQLQSLSESVPSRCALGPDRSYTSTEASWTLYFSKVRSLPLPI